MTLTEWLDAEEKKIEILKLNYEASKGHLYYGWGNGPYPVMEKMIAVIREMRERLALMAEGEGPDPEVYKEISNYALTTCEKIVMGDK